MDKNIFPPEFSKNKKIYYFNNECEKEKRDYNDENQLFSIIYNI